VAVRPTELVKDLKSEDFSARLEVMLKELVSDLNSEVCSAETETIVRDALKFLARLFV